VVEELSELGVAVDRVSTRASSLARKNLKLGRMPAFLKCSKEVERFLDKFEPEGVMVDDPYIYLLFCGFVPAFRKWKKKQRRSIGICHSNLPLLFRRMDKQYLSLILDWLIPVVQNQYDITLFPSEYVKQSFPKIKNGIVAGFLGVDKSAFRFVERKSSAKSINVISVGRISKDKNIEFLYHVAASLGRTDVHWRFVGDGPEFSYWKGKETEYITFVGHVQHKDLFQWYQTSDIFVSACDFESFGLAVVEAMSTGLPVLVPNTGAASTHFCEGVSGISFSPGDAGDFRQKLTRLIEDGNLRQRIGAAANEIVKDWKLTTSTLLDIF
jgi:glycosyltransferase involved in cell wall biosynthesis